MNRKKPVVVLTVLLIAGLFIIGADWAGETVQRFFQFYFADLAIPFAFYLLLVLVEQDYRLFRHWYIKAGAVFVLCSFSELLQYFGIYALARVFDPLDFVMYGAGVLFAAFTDRVLFKRMFRFWK